MSGVIAFSACKARPDNQGLTYYLTDHLEGVRHMMRSFFPGDADPVIKQLAELSALSHDIGKAHHEWQLYIQGRRKSGPNHSGCGAIFFSYMAYHWLKIHDLWAENQWLWLNMTRDVADHHGGLKGFSANHDIEKGAFDRMDLPGIQRWLYELYPVFQVEHVSFSVDDLEEWQYDQFEDFTWNIIYDVIQQSQSADKSVEDKMETLQKWRKITSYLISADRFDVQSVRERRFQRNDWKVIDQNIKDYCKQGMHHPLATIRMKAQQSIMEQWRRNKDRSFFILEMPTGYGKTLTSLQLASAIGKEKGHSKIIYIAPYLSILEQNADEIRKAMRQTPLEHHSLAILDQKVLNENENSDESADLVEQSWANAIVCTTFVQWMKALFPGRAQETLRRIFLEKSVVIIDEPQIIDASVWNLFLKGLEAVRNLYELDVIFVSATMPPFHYGLTEEPPRLSVTSKKENDRYAIQLVEPVTATECAGKLKDLQEPSGAAILNTIQDALDVYEKLSQANEADRYLLHGLMIPLHKKIQFKKVHSALNRAKENERKVRVVSTQIIEAGANVSFHYLYRALPILPSLTQAAGRVNRHQELTMGTVETGPFLREETEKDSRSFIYDATLCRITDDLLHQKENWLESEMDALVQQFYRRMFDENSYEAILNEITEAYHGHWLELSKYEVFKGEEVHRLPLFIPFDWREDEKWIPDTFKQLICEFAINDPADIHQLFLNRRLREQWNFAKNKRFMILFYQFVLNIPVEKALKIISKEAFLNERIPMLKDDSRYNHEKGLNINFNDIENSFI